MDNSLNLVWKYAQIFVHRHDLFRESQSSLRAYLKGNCELLGTDHVRGQLSKHIFMPNGGYCICHLSNIFEICAVLKIGEYITIIRQYSLSLGGIIALV